MIRREKLFQHAKAMRSERTLWLFPATTAASSVRAVASVAVVCMIYFWNCCGDSNLRKEWFLLGHGRRRNSVSHSREDMAAATGGGWSPRSTDGKCGQAASPQVTPVTTFSNQTQPPQDSMTFPNSTTSWKTSANPEVNKGHISFISQQWRWPWTPKRILTTTRTASARAH